MPKPINGTISGSRAATILGLNQWETSFSVWQKIMEELAPGFNKKMGYEFPIFEESAAVRFGNAFEDANISITEGKLSSKIFNREKVYEFETAGNPELPLLLSCHIDGELSGSTLFEGKTTSIMSWKNKWGDPGTDKIPANYQIQVQHNMMLSGLKECVVAVLVFPETPEKWESMGWESRDCGVGYRLSHPNNSVGNIINPNDWASVLSQMGYHHLYYIKRNDELIKLMQQKYQEFWTDFVITKKPPKPMNLDDIARLCPEPVGTIVIEDQNIIDIVNEYKSISKEISSSGDLSKRVKQLKTLFLDTARNLGAVEDDESKDKWIFRDSTGKKIASWAKNKKGNWSLR